MRRWLAAATLAAVAAAAWAAGEGDEDESAAGWKERPLELPGAPDPARFIALGVDGGGGARFAVDPASLSVGPDGVVRFVLSTTSAAGSRSITFEGLRCDPRERRLYATARADGSWQLSPGSRWRPVSPSGPNNYARTLHAQFFCPLWLPIHSTEEGVDALRRGAHPLMSRERSQ